MLIPEDLKAACMEQIKPYNCEGFIAGDGPLNPLLMFVGEAPGMTEIETGIPFNGKAGEYLDQFFDYLGCHRSEVFITSTVRSRPFKIIEKTDKSGNRIIKKPNRTPTKKEQIAHAPLLDYQIDHVKPEIIVTLGKIAYQRLTGDNRSLSHVHGDLQRRQIQRLTNEDTFVLSNQTYTVFPTYHPASVFYNRKLLEKIYQDLDSLKAFIHNKSD